MSEGASSKLTIRDRILIHLAEYPVGEGEVQVPEEVTQAGLAQGAGCEQRHVHQYVTPLLTSGLLTERSVHVRGGKQGKKAYFLTPQGRSEANRLRGNVLAQPAEVIAQDGNRRIMNLGEVVKGSFQGVPLLDLLRALESQGSLRIAFGPGKVTSSLGDPRVSFLMGEAGKKEELFDWLGAAEAYRKALILIPDSGPAAGGPLERLGYALYRAAMQADASREFRERLEGAREAYSKAQEAYTSEGKEATRARACRCGAWNSFIMYWLSPSVEEKKDALGHSWSLAKDALEGFRAGEEGLEYGKTYNQLSTAAYLRYTYEWEIQAREGIAREVLRDGEQAIRYLATMEDPQELTKSYVRTALLLEDSVLVVGGNADDRDEMFRRIRSYWLRAKEASPRAAFLELSALGWVSTNLGGGTGTPESLANIGRAMELARESRDRFRCGLATDLLAYHTYWTVLSCFEDPDKVTEILGKAMGLANEARAYYAPLTFVSPRCGVFWIEAPEVQYYWAMAECVGDIDAKRSFLEKGWGAAPELFRRAEASGYPYVISCAHHLLSSTLAGLARFLSDLEEKRGTLQRALDHRGKALRIDRAIYPAHYFDLGIDYAGLAKVKAQLAELYQEPETKWKLLKEALQDMDGGLDLFRRELPFLEREGSVVQLGVLAHSYLSWHGDCLTRLHRLSGNKDHLRRAIGSYREAIGYFQRLDLATRVAECHWKCAQVHDTLGEYIQAGEDFAAASRLYKIAVERIPQLKDLYQDHAIYMQSWSEIERARHHHGRQEYRQAEEYYERAATLHGLTKGWSSMTSNHAAWAQMENAEDLSRSEKGKEAVEAFEQAGKLFHESKASLQAEVGKISGSEGRQMATELIKAADRWFQYCKARISLEEGRIADKSGEHSTSASKYALAAESLEHLAGIAESEEDRRDLKLIAILSRAWQAMATAEAEASPSKYGEASHLFEEAKALGRDEKAKQLALGHSRFCKALEAGMEFADKGDEALYADALQQIESAAKFYLRAGFQSAAEYAKATRLLLDAYVHMDRAGREVEHEKSAKLYTVAEKLLEASAGAYAIAEQPGRKEQVERLLEKVRQEKAMALSLSELVGAPNIVSTTAAFSTPRPSYERAVGLERFEHGDVQASVIGPQKDMKVDENLELEIEMVNAGGGPAQLVKVEELIPEGFELISVAGTHRFEEGYLNMKGRRLEPLKTEEIKLVLRSKTQGRFLLKPRILYLDETGKYRSHEPDPIEVNVTGR